MATVQKESESKELESESVVYKLTKEFARKEKGYKGQIAKLQAELAKTEVKISPVESASSQTEPAQAVPEHLAHPWERKCSTCGGENEHFKAPPNVFCHGPKCNGRIPVGTVDVQEVLKLTKGPDGQFDISGMVKPCTNCGTHDYEVIEPGVVT